MSSFFESLVCTLFKSCNNFTFELDLEPFTSSKKLFRNVGYNLGWLMYSCERDFEATDLKAGSCFALHTAVCRAAYSVHVRVRSA